MAILGAHMSIAGGYYKAVHLAHDAGCDCVQLFTKNNNQWRAKPIDQSEATRFQKALRELDIFAPISHCSYLINLASPKDELRQKSIEAMLVELQRADLLGIRYVVMHPGSFTTSTEQEGLDQIARSIDTIFTRSAPPSAKILLETTAGQGSNLGWKFEHLKSIIQACDAKSQLGVCLDTCHMFAAGYPLAAPEDYDRTMDKLLKQVGIRRIKAIHLNDSKKPFGSRLDRHEHIGQGEMGLEPFRNLLHDERFSKVPMYLETPKGEEDGEDLDVMNLRTLRQLTQDA